MWLIPPSMSSAYAPELEDSNSELSWLFRELEQSAWWRGKPRLARAWSQAWKRAGWTKLLSGWAISSTSAREDIVASYISSLQATHARTTALPESAPEATASGSLLPRSSGSPTSAGLILSSGKTSRGTSASSLKPLSLHWSEWATALRQEYSVRPKPEIPCGASGCSSWPSASVMDTGDNTDLEKIQARREKHKARGINGSGFGMSLGEAARQWPAPMAGSPATDSYNEAGNSDFSRKTMELASDMLQWAAPQARDHFPPHSPERIAAMKAEGHGMRNLNDEAATWSSPKASDPEKAGPNMRGSKGDVPLPGQAAQWPGPSTGSNNSLRGGAQCPEKRKAGGHQVNLQDVACFFHPPSSPDQPIAAGSMSSTDGPNSNQPSVKRKLNPIFFEALMRWPTGLSGFERQETAWTLWWQLMRPFVFTLCSQNLVEEDMFS